MSTQQPHPEVLKSNQQKLKVSPDNNSNLNQLPVSMINLQSNKSIQKPKEVSNNQALMNNVAIMQNSSIINKKQNQIPSLIEEKKDIKKQQSIIVKPASDKIQTNSSLPLHKPQQFQKKQIQSQQKIKPIQQKKQSASKQQQKKPQKQSIQQKPLDNKNKIDTAPLTNPPKQNYNEITPIKEQLVNKQAQISQQIKQLPKQTQKNSQTKNSKEIFNNKNIEERKNIIQSLHKVAQQKKKIIQPKVKEQKNIDKQKLQSNSKNVQSNKNIQGNKLIQTNKVNQKVNKVLDSVEQGSNKKVITNQKQHGKKQEIKIQQQNSQKLVKQSQNPVQSGDKSSRIIKQTSQKQIKPSNQSPQPKPQVPITLQQLFDKFIYILTLSKQKTDKQQSKPIKNSSNNKKINFSIQLGQSKSTQINSNKNLNHNQKQQAIQNQNKLKNQNKFRIQIGLLSSTTKKQSSKSTKLQTQLKQIHFIEENKQIQTKKQSQHQENKINKEQQDKPSTENANKNQTKQQSPAIKLRIKLYNKSKQKNLQNTLIKINSKLGQYPTTYNKTKAQIFNSKKGKHIRMSIQSKNNNLSQYLVNKNSLQKLQKLLQFTSDKHSQESQKQIHKENKQLNGDNGTDKLVSLSFIQLRTFTDIKIHELQKSKLIKHIFKGFKFQVSSQIKQAELANNQVPQYFPKALHKMILEILPSGLSEYIQPIKNGNFNLKFKQVENLKTLLSKLGIQQVFQQTPSLHQILKQILYNNLKGLLSHKNSLNKGNTKISHQNKQEQQIQKKINQQLKQIWKILKTIFLNSQTQSIKIQILLQQKISINIIFQLTQNNTISSLSKQIFNKQKQ